MAENSIVTRFKNAWNAFRYNKDPTTYLSRYKYVGPSSSSRPDRVRLTRGNERTIITSVYNRIAMDVAAVDLCHAQLDKEGRYTDTLDSGLNECLTLSSNTDQTALAFKQDIVMSMFDEGCVAIVPVYTSTDPITGAYDILSLRTGRIMDWKPQHVVVRVYNEETGDKEDITLPKSMVGIVENPFYAVMNERNSVLQRLIRKLALLDAIDDQSGSGKLDIIIQLPYTIKNEQKRQQANNRRKDIEDQLSGSKYGIAYADAAEKITQLNRPVENNLMKQIEYLTSMLYSQLGITQSILDGTADEKTMANYFSRVVKPIVKAIVDEMKRKFLTKTARTQFKSIEFFRDPFELVTPLDMAEMADKYTRNEILSKNEVRQKGLGLKPSKDPKADQLINSNITQPTDKLQGKSSTPTNNDLKDVIERVTKKNEKKESANQNEKV